VIAMQGWSIMNFLTKSTYHKVFYQLFILLAHFILLYIFSLNLDILYFISLVFFAYLLHLGYRYFSLKMLLIFIMFCFVFSQTHLYEQMIFKIYFNLDLFDKVVYIDNEVNYILSFLHLLILVSLKRFYKK
jgi:hypothetical protein